MGILGRWPRNLTNLGEVKKLWHIPNVTLVMMAESLTKNEVHVTRLVYDEVYIEMGCPVLQPVVSVATSTSERVYQRFNPIKCRPDHP